ERFAQIARVYADPTWGKRLRARRSQLAREQAQAVERPQFDQSKIEVRVESEGSRADIALQVKGYTRRVGDRLLFDDAELDVRCGERLALIGPNGSGKSTFLRD